MINISISEELKQKVPDIVLSCIACRVYVMEKNDNLWDETRQKSQEILSGITTRQISAIPAIEASRKAYKACGKDPARYRLSAESLFRRVVQKKELYQVNNVVDSINLISLTTGFSIGGYDTDKIKGAVSFGIGKENEPYEGIGRGKLNIENLPVFRDEEGAFGTPTSDSVRTSVTTDTIFFAMVIINFGSGDLKLATELAVRLLKRYAYATDLKIKTITT